MFEALVLSVLMYGGGRIWEWKEYEGVERLYEKYIRWTLVLDSCTPGCIVLKEADRQKIRLRAGNRAYKYEEKLIDSGGRTRIKTCLKERESIRGEVKAIKERERYLNRHGWSKELVKEMHKNGIEVQQDLIER